MSKKGYKIRFVTNDDIYMKDRITQGITNIKDNEYQTGNGFVLIVVK